MLFQKSIFWCFVTASFISFHKKKKFSFFYFAVLLQNFFCFLIIMSNNFCFFVQILVTFSENFSFRGEQGLIKFRSALVLEKEAKKKAWRRPMCQGDQFCSHISLVSLTQRKTWCSFLYFEILSFDSISSLEKTT